MPTVLFESWDQVLRAAVATPIVYAAAVAAVRLAGRRTLAQMSAFDVVVTIAIGSVVAAAILPSSPAVADGVTALLLLLGCQVALGALRQRSPRLRTLLDFQPQLVAHGSCAHLTHSPSGPQLTAADVQRAVRHSGHTELERLSVVLESDGTFSVLAGSAADLPLLRQVPGAHCACRSSR